MTFFPSLWCKMSCQNHTVDYKTLCSCQQFSDPWHGGRDQENLLGGALGYTESLDEIIAKSCLDYRYEKWTKILYCKTKSEPVLQNEFTSSNNKNKVKSSTFYSLCAFSWVQPFTMSETGRSVTAFLLHRHKLMHAYPVHFFIFAGFHSSPPSCLHQVKQWPSTVRVCMVQVCTHEAHTGQSL